MGDGLDLDGFYLEAKYRKTHTICTLHKDTREKAKNENRIPISCVKEKYQKGFLYVVDSRDLDEFVMQMMKNRNLHIKEE